MPRVFVVTIESGATWTERQFLSPTQALEWIRHLAGDDGATVWDKKTGKELSMSELEDLASISRSKYPGGFV